MNEDACLHYMLHVAQCKHNGCGILNGYNANGYILFMKIVQH